VKAPNNEALQTALNTLDAQAVYTGKSEQPDRAT
jgi:hypothetical protein